jgi:hypothetical protein
VPPGDSPVGMDQRFEPIRTSSFTECHSEQACLQGRFGIGRVWNRQIRKAIYHLGGKPLTSTPAIILILKPEHLTISHPGLWHGPR